MTPTDPMQGNENKKELKKFILRRTVDEYFEIMAYDKKDAKLKTEQAENPYQVTILQETIIMPKQ